MKNSIIAIALAFALFAPAGLRAQSPFDVPGSNTTQPMKPADPQKEKLIRDLLTKTRDVELAQERILQGLAGMKQFMPRVPQKYWDEYRAHVNLDDIRNQLVQVYDKRFSTDEIKGLIQFYNSRVGQKLSQETLPILRASMDISQAASKQAGQVVAGQLRSDQFLQQPRASGSLGLGQGPGALAPNPFGAGPGSVSEDVGAAASPAASTTATPAGGPATTPAP